MVLKLGNNTQITAYRCVQLQNRSIARSLRFLHTNEQIKWLITTYIPRLRAIIRLDDELYEIIHDQEKIEVKKFASEQLASSNWIVDEFYTRKYIYNHCAVASIVHASARKSELNSILIEIKLNVDLYVMDHVEWPHDRSTELLSLSKTGTRFVSLWRVWKQPGFWSAEQKGPIVRLKGDEIVGEIGRLASGKTGMTGPVKYELSFKEEVPHIMCLLSIHLMDEFEMVV